MLLPPMRRDPRHDQTGAILIDALIAATLVVSACAGVLQLLATSRQAAWRAATASTSVALASQKIEQLASLTWSISSTGETRSDRATSLDTDPPTGGGSGLQPSPVGSLHRSEDGYVDYADDSGRWIGSGARPPPRAAYVRRWAIVPAAFDPEHTVVLHVAVLRIADERTGARAEAACLTAIRTRVLQ